MHGKCLWWKEMWEESGRERDRERERERKTSTKKNVFKFRSLLHEHVAVSIESFQYSITFLINRSRTFLSLLWRIRESIIDIYVAKTKNKETPWVYNIPKIENTQHCRIRKTEKPMNVAKIITNRMENEMSRKWRKTNMNKSPWEIVEEEVVSESLRFFSL